MSVITLTTDFGLEDQYVGSLHGVIVSLNPQARISDISHLIPSYDIAQASYVLGGSYFLFPKGSIHVVVVDPGVGSARKPILVQTENYFFIAPDNGVLSLALAREKIVRIIHLTNSDYFRSKLSHTFHGRDIFSPVAAHLSKGVSPDVFGPELTCVTRLDLYAHQVQSKKIRARIMAIDKFGNAVLYFHEDDFKEKMRKNSFVLKVGSHQIKKLNDAYWQVKKGDPILLFGSLGYLELATNQGSLAKKWKLKRGMVVELCL
ncbi:MAG TPA: hypothetical protein DDW49_00690 [Deltaproteobacteria bacterium]|nr:MAG: hypothetical protein A2048_10105 [Deltaproteobacteria bacterium GWA2_45_12]HBF11900.1 hypothetical protein [Deltaproteobacteria bacterium]